jgi:hypothetical protein
MPWSNIRTALLGAWASVTGPGETLALGFVALFCATWLAMNWRYGVIISTLRARLKLAEDEISAFEREFGGVSHSQAAARLKRLETNVAALPHRRLGDEQRRAIVEAAGPPPAAAPYLKVVDDAASAEVDRYARDFVEAFLAAPGWNVVHERHPRMPRAPAHGIAVGVSDPDHLTPTEQLVLGALHDAGVDCDVLPKMADGADVEIVVTAR